MDEIRNQSIKLFSEWLDKQTNFTTSIKIVCGQGFESIYDDYISRFISRRPEPLVRGMEIDVEALTKLLVDKDVYLGGKHGDKQTWCGGSLPMSIVAEHLKANAHVWLKEMGGE